MSTVSVPSVMSLSGLSDDENRLLGRLLAQLEGFQRHNGLVERYYEGKQLVRDMGISIPPHLRHIETVVGWPGTVVDVLEERLDIDGWVVPEHENDDLGVSDIVEDNRLEAEYSQIHLDTLTYGTSFITVGRGGQGEPDPIITYESPRWMTAIWDARRRSVTEALNVHSTDEQGQASGATLYLDGQTIHAERDGDSWRVVDRDQHRMGTPVFQMVNRPRRGDLGGRSEITRAVRSATDAGVRTMLGMEVSREFFAAPMLWVLGADESAFVGPDGNPKTAWETYIGRIKAISSDEDGNQPTVQQVPGSSPAPFLEVLRHLSRQLAAEAAIPESYFGVSSDNPASADAIRAFEARLVKRAERRHRTFGSVHGLAMRAALDMAHGGDVGVTPRPLWRDAATPTRAAAADEAVKLVGAGVLPADSEVTLERVGLSDVDRRRIMDDRRRARAGQTTAMLSAASGAPETPDYTEMKAQADAMGVLIRSGVDPEDAAARVGLGGVRFAGDGPVWQSSRDGR